jgi:WD40 repeat protein
MKRMKTLLHVLNRRNLPAACLTLAASICFAVGAGAPLPPDPSATLQRLQDQLDQQTKRVDRLYRALGPQLEGMEERAASLEKQQREDKELATELICKVEDESLTGIGCVNPAAAEFAVITDDGGVRIFDAKGKPVKELLQTDQAITCLAFAPNGSELLTGTREGALLAWDVAKGTCQTVCTNVGSKVDRVTWLGKDRVVWGGYVEYWKDGKPVDHDKQAGAVLARASGRVLWTFRGFVRNDFFTLAGAQDGSRLVVQEIPGQPRAAFLLDGASGEVRHTCYDKEHGSGPLSVAISPDGNILAVGYAPYDIILWNARTGARRMLLKGHSNWVVSLAFSADSKRLISGAGDSTARIWDIESGSEVGRVRFQGESSYVDGVGLSPKGDIAFAVVRGMLVVARVPPAKSSEKD